MEKLNLYEKIKSILNEWDPIGVYSRESLDGWPEWPDDEYCSYIAGLINLIKSNANDQDFFDYLWDIETGHIGLNGNKERTKIYVKKIIDMKHGS